MSDDRMKQLSFSSDNASGVHPEVLDALARANHGHATAYGNDPFTAAAIEKVRAQLGAQAEVLFAFGGTAANVIGLASVTAPFHAVICADGAHLHRDECGALERFGGKLLLAPTVHGKLDVDAVAAQIRGVGVVHSVQPRVISVSQATEVGTVYTPGELRALADFAHARDMLLHVDGARLANAAASLDVPLRAITTDAGVDLLSFGGTKNGLLGVEAVVFLRPALAAHAGYHRKQGMQLASKMRFLAAQFDAYLCDELWLRSARHANAMARRLADAVRGIPGVAIVHPVDTNGVFASVPGEHVATLQAAASFHVWEPGPRPVVRWMCSFDTTAEDVDALAALVRQTLS